MGLLWVDDLNRILLTKPAEVVQEACQVLEKHDYPVKEELKSELYYCSTLCQVVFQVLHYANLIVAHAPTAFVHARTHTDHTRTYTHTHTHIHTHTHTHTHVLTTHAHTLNLESRPSYDDNDILGHIVP